LILRPLVCANGQAVGIAVALRAPGPNDIDLSWQKNTKRVSPEVDDAQAAAIVPLNGQKNVVQAFLRTLK
jgi:hypothetical protein